MIEIKNLTSREILGRFPDFKTAIPELDRLLKDGKIPGNSPTIRVDSYKSGILQRSAAVIFSGGKWRFPKRDTPQETAPVHSQSRSTYAKQLRPFTASQNGRPSQWDKQCRHDIKNMFMDIRVLGWQR